MPAPSSSSARQLYRILLYLVHTDVGVDPRERAVLDGFRERWGIAPEEAAELESERSETGRLSLPNDAEERGLLVAALAEVVAADGALTRTEQRRLQRLAEFLGLPREELLREVMERLAGP